jgi:hypothetical protein
MHACDPSYSRDRGRRIKAQGWPGQKHETLCEKETKSKRTGGIVTQAIAYLPQDAPNSITGAAKKEKKKCAELCMCQLCHTHPGSTRATGDTVPCLQRMPSCGEIRRKERATAKYSAAVGRRVTEGGKDPDLEPSPEVASGRTCTTWGPV